MLLVTTFFVMQAALWMYHRQEAEAAAQRGAAAAAVVPPADRRLSPTAAAQAAADDARIAAEEWFGPGHKPRDLKVWPTFEGAEDDVVVIHVSYTVPSLLGRLSVSASAARPVEVFRPAPAGLGP